MDREEFVRRVNERYAAEGLPPLDGRDLPELARSGSVGNDPAERDVNSPAIRDFLTKKRQRIRLLGAEASCTACGRRFVPAGRLELYLYCDLVVPPPEGYCPDCLSRILRELDSRADAENMRCCG